MDHAELDYGLLHYSKETELHLRKQEVTERGFIQGNRVIKCGQRNVESWTKKCSGFRDSGAWTFD